MSPRPPTYRAQSRGFYPPSERPTQELHVYPSTYITGSIYHRHEDTAHERECIKTSTLMNATFSADSPHTLCRACCRTSESCATSSSGEKSPSTSRLNPSRDHFIKSQSADTQYKERARPPDTSIIFVTAATMFPRRASSSVLSAVRRRSFASTRTPVLFLLPHHCLAQHTLLFSVPPDLTRFVFSSLSCIHYPVSCDPVCCVCGYVCVCYPVCSRVRAHPDRNPR